MTDTHTEIREARHIGALWTGLLLAPSAFLLNLELSYLFVRPSCVQETVLPVHIVQTGCLLLAILGTLMAWRCWTAEGREWPDEAGGPVARTRFLAGVGFLASALFVLVIVAQWVPTFALHPCQ
jgi:hypothetical protein